MKVIYRACSVGSPDKIRPIKDKIELVDFCFKSFLEAFGGIEHDIVCLLDKPTNELRNIFKGLKTEESYFESFTDGNVGSFHRQLDLALESRDDFLLVEDDYYFLPDSGVCIESILKDIDGFFTPYDHPEYYKQERHRHPKSIRILGDRHWQSVDSTTLTFGGKYEALVKEIDVMKSYGWADEPMWNNITKRRNLWSPIPTLATHMETEFLSPVIKYPF